MSPTRFPRPVPRAVDGLIVAGRCIPTTSEAQGNTCLPIVYGLAQLPVLRGSTRSPTRLYATRGRCIRAAASSCNRERSPGRSSVRSPPTHDFLQSFAGTNSVAHVYTTEAADEEVTREAQPDRDCCPDSVADTTPAAADGIIIIDPPMPVPPPDFEGLIIRYHRVLVTIDGQVATTEASSGLQRRCHPLEGTHVFLRLVGAAVDDFLMWASRPGA